MAGRVPSQTFFLEMHNKIPSRPCVVQSLPSNCLSLKQKVVFSDDAILRVSNILAHQSVDLVVTVMAVLKAGATFSVIGQSFY